ncbi:glycoside hydrolase family 43 protein [Stenotrophomonas tumulicola]|uniref:Glycoside hydrolase family 43 protein n=1 Tax=Stenotrophomonas tumulicola TaxID=1685415 RepID=A0A7W3FIP0_9GAMM|nr:glycoside hydrolase family 43 protein [Stenotrophomonas tumulicola]MBA8680276.1 glycoside hydrolase family 43 protein [Stenotrophomonas tumulicola]
MLHWSARLLLGALLVSTTAAHAGAPVAFDDPLLPSGPDPWIVRDGDVFHYMGTHGDRLAIRTTRDLARLAEAPETTVWRPPASGPNARSIWAPELHRIDGSWYIYYTAAASGEGEATDQDRGIFVLQNDSDDPTQGEWRDRGQLATHQPGIDGTTFVVGDKRYFVYSPYVGPDSVLAIVAMSNPWTLAGEETIIARPDQAWERQGGRQILEGPEFLAGPDGDLFLAYSGSACWSDDYAIGLLRARAGSNPLDAGAWTKLSRPILTKNPQGNVYATGHNGFFEMADGKTWIVYHANPGPGMGCTAKRSPRIQPVHWNADGTPWLDPPTARRTAPAD